MAQPNAQYNTARPDSLAVRIATRVRAKMYRDFIDECGVSRDNTILDVGVTSDQSYSSSNYLSSNGAGSMGERSVDLVFF